MGGWHTSVAIITSVRLFHDKDLVLCHCNTHTFWFQRALGALLATTKCYKPTQVAGLHYITTELRIHKQIILYQILTDLILTAVCTSLSPHMQIRQPREVQAGVIELEKHTERAKCIDLLKSKDNNF